MGIIVFGGVFFFVVMRIWVICFGLWLMWEFVCVILSLCSFIFLVLLSLRMLLVFLFWRLFVGRVVFCVMCWVSGLW